MDARSYVLPGSRVNGRPASFVGRIALPASWNQLFVFFAGFVVKWFQNPR